MNISLFAFIVWLTLAFAGGVAVGALIIYKREEDTLTTMMNQAVSLTEAEKELRAERDELKRTREIVDTIDNVPEYLRDKYYTNCTTDSEDDEDETNTGIDPDEDIQIYM